MPLGYDPVMLLAQELQDPPLLPQLFFENPWPIVVGMVLVWAVLRITGRRTRQNRLMFASWVVLALAIAVMFVASVVQTPREKLVQAMETLITAIERGDVETFHGLVPEDAKATYFGIPFNRQQVDARLDEADLEDLTLVSQTAGLIGDQRAVVYMRVRATGGGGFISISDWAIVWEVRDGAWQAIEFRHEGEATDNLFGNPGRD